MKYSRRKGYFKYYNKDGLKCRIKFMDNVCNHETPFGVIVKFKRPIDDDFLYHYPNRKFTGIQDVINFVVKNLEHDGTVFEISTSKGKK
jgi:hypothetical protein